MSAQTSRAAAGQQASAAATFTVFSAHSGKVYACCVAIDLALGWAQPYGGRREDLLSLALCDSWRSHPEPQGIAVMRVI